MDRLPPYADTPIGRELLAAIIANPPEEVTINHRLPSIYGGYPDGASTSFVGKSAARLRRLESEWKERNFAALDRQFAVSGVWDDAASRAVLKAESANDLIARVLRDAAMGAAA